MSLRRIFWGVFVLSLSLLLFELTLIRVYSATLFYHFAFMAISVAMLGIAAAGLTVHLKPESFSVENVNNWTLRWSIIFGISLPVVFWIVFRIPVNAYLPPNQIAGKLSLIYILSAVPFYCAGIVFSGLFSAMPEKIGKLYSWDLVGAGVGSLAMLPLMNLIGGETAGLVISAFAFLAALSFAGKKRRKVPAILLAVMLIMCVTNPVVKWLNIQYTKGQALKDLDVRYNKWNSFSRIMAIPFRPGTDAVYTWCPSPNFPLPIMEHLSIMIDDGAATPVLPFDGKNLEPINYLKYDLTSLPHRMRGFGNTMIIGCGGGRDVLTGLMFGAKQIDAVDINPLIFEAMNGPLASFNGNLYRHPRVKGIAAEGRAYARRHPEEYDLLQIAMIDTWAATTAGAYSLSENTLYTVEAFQDYLKALKPNGVLGFTRFFFYPPRQALRIVSVYLEAARRMGIEKPEECILIGKFESLATLMFKKEPFTQGEIDIFKRDLKILGFELVYSPDERVDPFFRGLIDIPDKGKYYAAYPFDITPTTDNRPFFFNMLKIPDFLRVFEIKEGQMFNYYATYTLMVVFILSILATVVVLGLPLLVKGAGFDQFAGRSNLLFYFVSIGLAYIIIEVVLLQRFVLLLEHPAYAAAGVVAGMLISSGLGSLVWGRTITGRRKLARIAFSVITVGLLFHVLLGDIVVHSIIHFPLFVKVFAAAILVLPLGFAMGIPLPLGVTIAGQKGSGTVAWCWALNGGASVVASSLAVLLAMASGYELALLFGLLCYLAALFLSKRFAGEL